MTISEIKLINVKTQEIIDAANHTMGYSKTIIEQSQKLLRGIKEPIVFETEVFLLP